jgi:hypothetical protein
MSENELVTIVELARVALNDVDIFDYFAEMLDLSDEYMIELREKVQSITEDVGFPVN